MLAKIEIFKNPTIGWVFYVIIKKLVCYNISRSYHFKT